MSDAKKTTRNKFPRNKTEGYILDSKGKGFFCHFTGEQPEPITTIDALLDCSFLFRGRQLPTPVVEDDRSPAISLF